MSFEGVVVEDELVTVSAEPSRFAGDDGRAVGLFNFAWGG